MKAPFSKYLGTIAPGIKKLIAILSEDFDYVSVLSTDTSGFAVRFGQRNKAVDHSTLFTERGNVIRVYKDGLYSEFSFNHFDPERPELTAAEAKEALGAQFELLKACGTKVYKTEKLADEPITVFEEMETEQMPEDADISGIIEKFNKLSDSALDEAAGIIDCRISGQSQHVNKMFMTANRDMRQSYVYSECSIVPILVKDGKPMFAYCGDSGRMGQELFDNLGGVVEDAVKRVKDIAASTRIVPGEYDVITSPEVTGLIAHEAFGHGVEMDMFVKNRALGAQYIDKRVGSDLVTMHEGAKAGIEVSSYAFDDEGTLASDTIEIQNGILKTGVCDALSALRLGTKPTGNGKRENFEHKVYTRMTNTIFESGSSSLDEMIASIDNGYLLVGMQSGMEDPKHWGIQCIIESGHEIKDGKLTGKVVSPIIMTGYVPDLLGSISMLSSGCELFGSGGCGKGHKEWVKVSDGGPYMKAKARLG